MSDWRSPNGLPIAATGSPTAMRAEEPSRSGVSERPARVDLEQRDVGVEVHADDLRLHTVAVGELDVHLLGAVAARASLVTTCALVAM